MGQVQWCASSEDPQIEPGASKGDESESIVYFIQTQQHSNIQKYYDTNDVNERVNFRGDTVLHYAAHMGDLRLLMLLKRKGADPSIRNDAGETALDVAKTNYDDQPIMEKIESSLNFNDFARKPSEQDNTVIDKRSQIELYELPTNETAIEAYHNWFQGKDSLPLYKFIQHLHIKHNELELEQLQKIIQLIMNKQIEDLIHAQELDYFYRVLWNEQTIPKFIEEAMQCK